MCQRDDNSEISTLDDQLNGIRKGNTKEKKNHMQRREILSS